MEEIIQEMTRVRVGRRVIRFFRVSSVQFLGYYRKDGQEYSAIVFEFEKGEFEVPGVDGKFNSLEECAAEIFKL